MTEHASQRPSYVPYLLVFAALAVLTVLTYGVALVNLGVLNDVVALAIAVTKATLVVLIFMHVAHSSRLTKLTVVASLFWLAIMISLTLSDYVTRPAVSRFRGIPSSRLVGQLGETPDQEPGAAAPQGAQPLPGPQAPQP